MNHRWIAASAIVCAVLAGCSDPTSPRAERRIVFAGQFPGNTFQQIWIIEPDGSGFKPITNSVDQASWPRWSRDHQRVALMMQPVSVPASVIDIRPDGSSAHDLIPAGQCRAQWTYITWSPDATRMIAECADEEQFVVNLVDGSKYSLTQEWNAAATSPDWSAVGDRILYLRASNLYAANLDGSNAQIIAANAAAAGRWSYDGQHVVYPQTLPVFSYVSSAIFVVDSDGRGAHQITFPPGDHADVSPSFSPDGSQIVFMRYNSFLNSDRELWIVGVNGQDLHQLTPTGMTALSPDW